MIDDDPKRLTGFVPTEWQMKLLNVLSEDGGFTTGRASGMAWCGRFTGRNGGRIQSASARLDLLELEHHGLVSRLDDQKPVAWCRTTGGTKLLEFWQGCGP